MTQSIKHTRSLFPGLLLALLGVVACGDPATGDDAGPSTDGGPMIDSGPIVQTDAGPLRDAGPLTPLCTSGCQIVEMALGSDHTCGRRENGQVLCWGRDKEGQLGDGTLRHVGPCSTGSDGMDTFCSSTAWPVRVNEGGTFAPLDNATQISAEGALSTCAIRDGEVVCWGLEGISRISGGMGQQRLSAERIEDFGGVQQVSDGFGHLCMIVGSDNHALCYGFNSSGELGNADSADVRVPDPEMFVVDPGDESIPLTGIEQIIANGFGDVTCARTSDRVYCWGSDENGQFGEGAGVSHETCNPSGGAVTYDCSPLPIMVGGEASPLTGATDITVGADHICALMTGGTVSCWGDNRVGQAGPAESDTVHSPTEVSGLTGVTQVAAGGHFTCALTDAGTVHCWGFNFNGQLGDGMLSHGEACSFGSETGDCSPTPVQVSGIDSAASIWVGRTHACAIGETGDIQCWGSNSNRQLGDGTDIDQSTPVQVTGIPD